MSLGAVCLTGGCAFGIHLRRADFPAVKNLA
jgi:hypothetical protein